ncbi:MAG: glycosyltransferase family 9 protein [Bacteroidota bacterium]|nr:glycosyltransferase family 9 protein [Bacteroidota bacterium]
MPERAEHIVLSRTDSIGDVMLTLPMADLIKKRFPNAYITFLGRAYTVPILERCAHIDNILTLEQLTLNSDRGAIETLRRLHIDAFIHVFPVRRIARWAAHAGIPHRIGTSHRWWHWLNCNHRIAFSRKNSDLHEAQLNTRLLAPFGITDQLGTTELAAYAGFFATPLDPELRHFIRPDKKNVILHPHSSGSAVEWDLDRYSELIRLLHPAHFNIIVTGTALEAERYRTKLQLNRSNVTDVGGQLDLQQLIGLINACDALVAASTGPLHIAAACGIRAIGLYANARPIHPGRWAPVGKDPHALFEDDVAEDADLQTRINAIRADKIMRLLEEML